MSRLLPHSYSTVFCVRQ